MSLAVDKLPFPLKDLGWDKFATVMKFCGLTQEECVTVLTAAIGDPPPGFDT